MNKEIQQLLYKCYSTLLKEFRMTSKFKFIINNFDKNNFIPEQLPTVFSSAAAIDDTKNEYAFQTQSKEYIIENCVIEYLASLAKNEYDLKGRLQTIIDSETEVNKVTRIIYSHITWFLEERLLLPIGLIDKLSLQTHEKAPCSGWLCFSDSFKDSEILMKFKIDTSEIIYFSFDKERVIRKLIETTKDTTATNIHTCLGFEMKHQGENEQHFFTTSYVKSKLENKLYINIIGANQWKLYLGETLILIYEYGKYYATEASKESKWVDLSKLVFNKSQKSLHSSIKKFIKRLYNEPNYHGALLIFSNNTKYFQRMAHCNRGIEIEESSALNITIFNKKSYLPEQQALLINLCMIDGAVIFDMKGNLQDYGVILDGLVRRAGDRSKGSRHNSAKTFVDYQAYDEEGNRKNEYKYYIIILSEDKGEPIILTPDEAKINIIK